MTSYPWSKYTWLRTAATKCGIFHRFRAVQYARRRGIELHEFHTFCSGCCWDTGIAEQEIDFVTNIAEGYDFISDPTLILSRSNRLKDMFPSGWAMPEHSSTLSTERKIRLWSCGIWRNDPRCGIYSYYGEYSYQEAQLLVPVSFNPRQVVSPSNNRRHCISVDNDSDNF